MPRKVEVLRRRLANEISHIAYLLLEIWGRYCRLPTLPAYWDMLNSFDWKRWKQISDDDGVPSKRWARHNLPLLFKLEILASRSAAHEELLGQFFCSGAAGENFPKRP